MNDLPRNFKLKTKTIKIAFDIIIFSTLFSYSSNMVSNISLKFEENKTLFSGGKFAN